MMLPIPRTASMEENGNSSVNTTKKLIASSSFSSSTSTAATPRNKVIIPQQQQRTTRRLFRVKTLVLCFLSLFTIMPFWFFVHLDYLGGGAANDEHVINRLRDEARVLSLKKELHRPDQEGLSACLLVKDANSLIPEWIAYHYHFLPLRYLIVAVDPESKTSPSQVLSGWNKTNELGLHIELWHDEDYVGWMPGYLPDNHSPNATHTQIVDRIQKRHQFRQGWFISRCLSQIKHQNRSWTYIGDVDEYLIFNRVKEGRRLPNTLKDIKPHSMARRMFANRKRLPKMEDSTVAALIEQERNNIPWTDVCFQVPRVRFGPKESTIDQVNKALPSKNFDPKAYHTIRFRHHAHPGRILVGKFVKPFMDASRIPNHILRRRASNPHKPYEEVCQFKSFSNEYHLIAPLIINHYFGEVDAFHGGDDVNLTFFQRSRQGKYEEFNREVRQLIDDDEIRPWLKDFVTVHGEETAHQLLEKHKHPPMDTDGTTEKHVKRDDVNNEAQQRDYNDHQMRETIAAFERRIVELDKERKLEMKALMDEMKAREEKTKSDLDAMEKRILDSQEDLLMLLEKSNSAAGGSKPNPGKGGEGTEW